MLEPRRPADVVGTRAHTPRKILRRIPWLVCSRCGLVYLNNEATRRAIRAGCWVWRDEKQGP